MYRAGIIQRRTTPDLDVVGRNELKVSPGGSHGMQAMKDKIGTRTEAIERDGDLDLATKRERHP